MSGNPRIVSGIVIGLALAMQMLVASVALSATEASPDPAFRADESTRRRGAILGGALGRGSGDFDVSSDSGTLSSGWGSGGNIVRGRVGWALTEQLVVIGEYGVWRRPEASSDSAASSSTSEVGPVDRYLGAGSLSINLYPQLGGFLLKAGIGYGQASATVTDAAGNSVTAESKGPMVILGVGYEHFFSHDMSIVLGVDVGRIEAGPELSGNTLQYTVAFQAYFPRGLPKKWF